MSTDKRRDDSAPGCWQAILALALLLYLGVVPLGVTFLAERARSLVPAPGLLYAAALLITGGLLLTPAGVVLWLVHDRQAWRPLGSVAAAAALLTGYLLLDGLVRAAFPESTKPVLHGEGADAAAVRLALLLPYLWLAAGGAPRLVGLPAPRRRRAWLGLGRPDAALVLIALAIAALLTLPWPLTGALGDSITTLSILFQTLAAVLPNVLLLWGILFRLLTATFTRPWLAALTTISLAMLTASAAALPTADWQALADAVYLFPLAFLLTELRARGRTVYPLLPVAFLYRAIPLIFVDPRDALAQGIPEPEHILAHTVVLVTAALLGPVLWGGRRLWLSLRDRPSIPPAARFAAAGLVALTLWALWSGGYLIFGEVGFANDGFLIIMEEQADLSDIAAIPDREERLQAAYDALVETAERTQPPIRAELNGLGVPYRPYYLINMIRVDGHRWLMPRFAKRPGVAQVLLNPNVREYPHRIPIPYTDGESPAEPLPPNLAAIHADEAWSLGVTGEGIVVAGQDTGYDWTHPALQPHYRGWDGITATHDYNWHDAWDDTAVPFDDDSHGTHTMGIVLGDDGLGYTIGVAPGAQWMGCRNMRRGFGNPAAYTECMEFFLAPYPHGGDPFSDGDVRYAPHVINNSWGCPDFEGCRPDTLRPAVEALRAAGIMMVVSVGNDGPACDTATTPPANYDAVFSVGATDDEGQIVGFSSRGPADGGLIKPDVSAPGAYVRSSVPGGEYRYAGGTSMAGPHVAGLVALLWSANPSLIGDIEGTEELICRTASPRPVAATCTGAVDKGPFAGLISNPVCACGDVFGSPNNVYGCGFIDAGAAVRAALGR